jgi:hypothetical protein
VYAGPHGWEAWAVEVRDSLAWMGRLLSTDQAQAQALSRTAVHASCP